MERQQFIIEEIKKLEVAGLVRGVLHPTWLANLVVPGVGIQEAKQITYGSGINGLIDAWQGEWVLWACFIQIYEIYAKPPFFVSLAYGHWVC